MSEAVIQFKNVWKKFQKGEKFNSIRDAFPAFLNNLVKKSNGQTELRSKEFWALKNVDFEIKRGEVVGVLGPNGAGKSTILKLLSRIMFPNQGKINIKGRLAALIEVSAGFHPDLTGRENVYLNGTVLGMKTREIDKKFEEIVDFSGVEEFIDTPVKRYSSGMYSRLGFAVAAYMDPEILLVDEVLSVGDSSFQAKCAEKMRELLNGGATILLVSHNLPLIQSMCKRGILLLKGEVVKDGPIAEVLPYYETVIIKSRERQLLEKHQENVELGLATVKETDMTIEEVRLLDHLGNKKDIFTLGEQIQMEINISSKNVIEQPLFKVEILRSDGVVCCAANSKDAQFHVQSVHKSLKIKLDWANLFLAPDIYLMKVSVCDKELIHTHATRCQDVLKFQVDRERLITNAVMIPDVKWSTMS